MAQSFVLAAFATLVFFAKAQNLRIRLVPNSWDSYAGFFWHRALVLLLLKKQGNSTFCKVVKI